MQRSAPGIYVGIHSLVSIPIIWYAPNILAGLVAFVFSATLTTRVGLNEAAARSIEIRSGLLQGRAWCPRVPSPNQFDGQFLWHPSGKTDMLCTRRDGAEWNFTSILCLYTCASGWMHRKIPKWGNDSAVRDICEYNARFYSYFY